MNCNDVYPRLEEHLSRFFEGHESDTFVWTAGPIQSALPRFRVQRFSPGPQHPYWVYVSVGAWKATHDAGSGLEFMVVAPEADPRHVELLAMIAHYHLRQKLGKWHTLPIGGPWLPGSDLDHILVSPPYPFGPELETCDVQDGHIHILWLLPISNREREFKVEHGVDALEQHLEDKGIEYWNPRRRSAV